MQKLTHVCRALRNKKVVRLFSCSIYSSYSTILGANSDKILNVTNGIIERLALSQEARVSVSALKSVSEQSQSLLAHSYGGKTSFKQLYKRYKQTTKARHEYEQINKYLKGKTILDFGCGNALFSSYLSRRGYTVSGTDTNDHRANTARNIHFLSLNELMSSAAHTNWFDTTVVKSVLHHINPEKVEQTIAAIAKLTRKRVLIKEDVILDAHADRALLVDSTNIFLEQYFRLTHQEMFEFLALMDFFGNHVAHGLSFINLPFVFKKIREWNRMFERNGLLVAKVMPALFSRNVLHAGPHVWFVCDVKKA